LKRCLARGRLDQLDFGKIPLIDLWIKRKQPLRLHQSVSPDEKIGQQTSRAYTRRPSAPRCVARKADTGFGPNPFIHLEVDRNASGFKKSSNILLRGSWIGQ